MSGSAQDALPTGHIDLLVTRKQFRGANREDTPTENRRTERGLGDIWLKPGLELRGFNAAAGRCYRRRR